MDVLSRSDRFQVAAISDPRAEVLRRYEGENASWQLFDDPREMILRSDLQMLMVWRGDGHEDSLLLALDKGVWMALRAAGEMSTDFSTKLLRQARKQHVGAFLWMPWTFVPSFQSVTESLGDRQVRLVLARVAASDETLDWPTLAHPLVAVAYPSIVLVQRCMGLPERVFCRETVDPGQDSNRPVCYGCTLSLIYPQAVASVFASLNAGPDRCEFSIQTSDGTVEAGLPQTHWYDCRGTLVAGTENYTTDQARRIGYERNLNALWQAYQERQGATEFDLRRHIGVMAVLEAAALSARTGDPEQLAKVAELSEIVALG